MSQDVTADGPPPEWVTAIAEVQEDDVLVRGHQLGDLVAETSFIEMIFLIVRGDLPTKEEARMLDALFVSLIEHGISPSSILVRMLASCGTPIQAALAGGVLSIADFHGGSCEQLGQAVTGVVDEVGDDGDEALRSAMKAFVAERRAAKQPVPGFGHPQHPEGDPRTRMLLGMARDLGVAGRYEHAVMVLSEELSSSLNRPMPPNVMGALTACMLDLGFSWRALRGLVISSRTAGLAAHYVEEVTQGGKWRHASSERVQYTGPRTPPAA